MGNTKSKNNELVVIGEPTGGLGNQLFVIATTYAYSRKYNKRFLLRENWKSISKDRPSYWRNILQFLRQNENLVYDSQIKKVKDYTYYDVMYKEIPNFNHNILLKGYFQSEKYFKDYKNEILSLFTFPESCDKLANIRIANFRDETMVAIHIFRRYDNQNSNDYHSLSLDYYNRAKRILEEKIGFRPTYLYFSNDHIWVKNNFKLEDKDEIINEKKDYIDFSIMSKCHHFIISNSTFSWWPAYLSNTFKNSTEKIVIAPEYWYNFDKFQDWNDIYPESWIKVKDYFKGYFEGIIEDNHINLESRYWKDDIIIRDDMVFDRYSNDDRGMIYFNDKVNLIYDDKIDNIDTDENLDYFLKKQSEYIKTKISSLIYNENNIYDVYLISIQDRRDRRDAFLENIKNYNINVNHFNAIKHPKGSFGCTLSHLYLVQYAKDNNLPYIIVMEDDGKILIDKDKFNNILNILTSNLDKWEVFNGSPSFSFYMDKFEKSILSETFSELFYEINYALATTFTIYNSSIYDKILQCNMKNPIDVHISDSVKQLFLKKEPFSVQVNFYSDVEKRNPVYNWEDFFKKEYQLLKNKLVKKYDSETLIPKIVHFILFLKDENQEFSLIYALSIISAMLVINPKAIYFWYDTEPQGILWEKVKPYLTLKKTEVPNYIGKKKLVKMAHKADIVRMRILQEYGGIYLDMDTISIKNINHLLNNEFVIGKELDKGLCNAIMMSNKDSSFLKEWWSQYEKFFASNGWGEASIQLPFKLSKINKKIYIANEEIFLKPSWTETHKIFEGEEDIPQKLLILHLWETHSRKYYTYKSLDDILESNCMYAKIIKYLNEKYNLKNYL